MAYNESFESSPINLKTCVITHSFCENFELLVLENILCGAKQNVEKFVDMVLLFIRLGNHFLLIFKIEREKNNLN